MNRKSQSVLLIGAIISLGLLLYFTISPTIVNGAKETPIPSEILDWEPKEELVKHIGTKIGETRSQAYFYCGVSEANRNVAKVGLFTSTLYKGAGFLMNVRVGNQFTLVFTINDELPYDLRYRKAKYEVVDFNQQFITLRLVEVIP